MPPTTTTTKQRHSHNTRGRIGVGSDGGMSGAVFPWSRYQQQPPMEREEFRVQSHTILHTKLCIHTHTRARAHTCTDARTDQTHAQTHAHIHHFQAQTTPLASVKRTGREECGEQGQPQVAKRAAHPLPGESPSE